MQLNNVITAILDLARQWKTGFEGNLSDDLLQSFDRLVALTGLILWAADKEPPKVTAKSKTSEESLAARLAKVTNQEIADLLINLRDEIKPADELVFQISINRSAMPALKRSIPAVKADAARTFSASTARKSHGP